MNSFVVVQFTLSLALLAGAGLLIRNFNELTHRNLGIDADHLLTMSISISGESYESAASKRNLMRSLMERVRSTPGVLEAGITTTNPLGGGTWVAPVVAAGRETNSDAATVLVNHRLVTPDLHRAMRIPLIRGRFFDERDNETSVRVVIVSRLMAQKLWPKQDALNQRVRINAPGQPWLTVVGVVGDVLDSHDPDQPKETWYLPYDQFADTPAASSIFLMVRANDPASIEQSVERAIHNVDQDLAIFDISTMDRFYLEGLSQNRLSAMLISILAGFGLLLGALGIYGTLSLAVNERFREIAIRIAVGAQSNQIVRLLLTQGMKLTMFACFFGIFCAWAVGQILRNQLSLVSPFDPIALLSAALVFFIVAIISVYLPAKRATTMDPIGALRET